MKAAGRVGRNRNFCDVPVSQLKCVPDAQARRRYFDLETGGKRRWNQNRRCALMDLHDLDTEHILDQGKDGPGMMLQKSADRGKFTRDMEFGPANRCVPAFPVSKSTSKETFPAALEPGARRHFLIDLNHLDGLNLDLSSGGEGHEIVD